MEHLANHILCVRYVWRENPHHQLFSHKQKRCDNISIIQHLLCDIYCRYHFYTCTWRYNGEIVIVSSPAEIIWNDRPLPDVRVVNKDCAILAWFEYKDNEGLKKIDLIHPYEDELNPLRWHDNMLPIDINEVKYWAWIKK